MEKMSQFILSKFTSFILVYYRVQQKCRFYSVGRSPRRQALSRLATLHASSIYQFLAVLHIVPSSCGQINGEQTFDQNSVKIGNLAVFPEILRSTPPRPALPFPTSYMHANLFKSLLTR